MTDPHQEGGLMAMKEILGMCEAAGLGFVNHAFNVTTVTMTSHMHVMATSSACLLALQGHPDYLADDYVISPTDYSGGKMHLSGSPRPGPRDRSRQGQGFFIKPF
jgi:L-alanine-DL-glutamate epimerase-like enolase superfamily enzyme